MIPGEWMAAAACANADPDLFTGTPGMEPATTRSARETRAKTICARCPVRVECLTYAVTAEVPLEGVWGGCGESELRIAARAWARDGVMPGQKICKTCKDPKPVGEFSPRGKYLAPSCQAV